MTALHLAVIIACAITFAAFGCAAGLRFSSYGKDTIELQLFKAISLFGLLSALFGVIFWPAAGVRGYVGLALFALALALFLWAMWTLRGQRITRIYCNDTPQILVTSGPFRLVRHPCYTAYLIGFSAAAIASGCPWLYLVTGAMAILYLHAARHEEQKFAHSPLAEDYQRYRERR